ncbi:glycoside hydrolase family 15 protein [Pseudanabaena sp. BC1403]|uniref:glycoside hydrolase family 15 protein n=1 Tax=Pseudanabaena sp. BC1403 TaxID=2043171 RepID=UPI000CD92465|nr:glycoside hydrolase family 15 protein [Pseudanabaena sp. BC1403]
MFIVNNKELEKFIKHKYTPQDIRLLSHFLIEKGTFYFSALDNGLFPAASAVSAENTGYSYVWVRDNIYVAYAHYILGQVDIAVKNVLTLMSYFKKHKFRFESIIDGRADPAIAMNRPHIRFNGQLLLEVDESWEHAQNDALGYFLWFYCKLASEGHFSLHQDDIEMLGLFPLYFQAVQYWKDEDSGHWEEGRKIEASSIGVAVAGLRALKQLFSDPLFDSHCCLNKDELVTPHLLDELISNGEFTLSEILPAECIQSKPKERRFDGALLFLIYPLNVLNEEVSDKIIQDIKTNLQGEYGIPRYLGDSFWCRNFFADLPENIQTSISTEREAWLEANNKTVKQGEEAQWCIFDPIISVIYGVKFQKKRCEADLEQQIYYLNRALGQVTGENCKVGKYNIEQFKCPELYYIQDDKYIPNVSTPLLWTQANLMIALKSIEQSLMLV